MGCCHSWSLFHCKTWHRFVYRNKIILPGNFVLYLFNAFVYILYVLKRVFKWMISSPRHNEAWKWIIYMWTFCSIFVNLLLFFALRRQWVREEDLARSLKVHSKQLRRILRFFEEEKLVNRYHRKEVSIYQGSTWTMLFIGSTIHVPNQWATKSYLCDIKIFKQMSWLDGIMEAVKIKVG